MAALAVLGAVSSSLALTDYTFKKINALRLAHKHLQEVEQRLGPWSERYSEMLDSLQKIEKKLECGDHLLNEEEVRDFDAHCKLIKPSLEQAKKVVDEIYDLCSSSQAAAASSSNIRKQSTMSKLRPREFVRRRAAEVKEALNIEMLLPKVEPVESAIKDAMRELSSMLRLLGIHSRLCSIIDKVDDIRKQVNCMKSDTRKNASTNTDRFKKHFDKPILPPCVVPDFNSRDESGQLTAAGLLKEKVLSLLSDESGRIASAVGKSRDTEGACGMGGVGKTVALQGLCNDEEVVNAYKDGVCFLVLGQDANDKKVIDQIAMSVRKFGGRDLSAEIEKMEEVTKAVHEGARWFSNRTVLFVCDDVWYSPTSSVGYLDNVRNLMSHAPNSRLVISTRDRKIASAMDLSVPFEPLCPRGESARKILLGQLREREDFAASFTSDSAREIEYVLDTCAGLPLALAIAGSALKREVQYCGENVADGIERFCNDLRQDIGCITYDRLREYPGLRSVIESSLKQCQQWGMTEETQSRLGRTFDMSSLFEALCVLKKQMIMPLRALKLLWGVTDRQATAIMKEFADCNLVKIELLMTSGESENANNEYGLRLHDLVLARCQVVAESKHHCSKWHKKILDGYYTHALANEHGEEDEESSPRSWWSNWHEALSAFLWSGTAYLRTERDLRDSRPWWKVRDDGYIYDNVSRHMVGAELQDELELLLCDVRWTLKRGELGGWLALNSEFEDLHRTGKVSEESGMSKIWNVLKISWPYIQRSTNEIGLQIFGRFERSERKKKNVRKLLSTIEGHMPRPWLRPVHKCFTPIDSREDDRVHFASAVNDTAVLWNENKFILACGKDILIWCMKERKELCKMEAHNSPVNCIAVSPDGKMIYSGSRDRTIRRWNAETGESVGDAMRGHEDWVTCIAVSPDGKMIYSGSDDGTIRRWNAETGESVGDAMRGHEDWVRCIAVSPDGKMIYSGSGDGTIHRWNAETGESVGDAMRGHADLVAWLSVNDNNMFLSSAERRDERACVHGNERTIGFDSAFVLQFIRGIFSSTIGLENLRELFVQGPKRRESGTSGVRLNERVHLCDDEAYESLVGTLPSKCVVSRFDSRNNCAAFGLRNGQVVICSIVR